MLIQKCKKIMIIGSMLIPLSACSEAWISEKTTTHFPYGNARTAGSGVAYVRAQMLPERQLNLSIEKDGIKKIMNADNLFRKMQKK